MFFQIVNSHPEKRKNVRFQHLENWNDYVNVRTRPLIHEASGSRRVTLLCEPSPCRQLHLRPLIKNMKRTLESLYLWTPVSQSVGETFGSETQPLPIADVPLLVPIASRATVERAAAFSSGPARDPAAGVLAIHTTDAVAVAALGQISDLQGGEPDVWVHVADLPADARNAVVPLSNAGALHLASDENQQMCVRRNPSGAKFISKFIVGNPAQVLFLDSYSRGSKLDLVLALRRGGWTSCDPRKDLEPQTPKEFIGGHHKPLSYFLVMLQSGLLFESGVQRIPHHLKDFHCLCFLRLHGQQLLDVCRKLQDMTKTECQKMLRDANPTLQRLAVPLEDDVVPDDDPANDPNEFGALVPLPPITVVHRAVVSFDGGKVYKIIMDHFTSANDRQRGYCNCLDERHDNCFKWMYPDSFPSKERYVACLARWAEDAYLFTSRETHMAHMPQQADVDVALLTLSIEDF